MTGIETYAVDAWMGVLMTDMGIAPGDVLRRAGLPGDLFSRGATMLTPQEYFGMWTALEEEAADPAALPVLVGRSLSVEAFDPMLFAAICSPDLNVAARRVGRFKQLLAPMRLEVSRTATETTIAFVWPPHPPPPQGLVAAELVFWVALARLATRSEIRPLRIGMPDPPARQDAYRAYLGGPVAGRSRPAVTFSATDAARPFVTASDQMWEFFEPELRRRLSQLEVGASTADRVRAALHELLPLGEASVEAVARALRVSPRTLQRRLGGEGTTFQATLTATREALARHYLAHSLLSAAEIALLLGYEDPNSFYRAFHGWTGRTPQRVRAGAA